MNIWLRRVTKKIQMFGSSVDGAQTYSYNERTPSIFPMRDALPFLTFLLASLPFAMAEPLPGGCERPPAGGVVAPPGELHAVSEKLVSKKLSVAFSFQTSVDVYGLTRYCYVYGEQQEAPTLRVQPGDELQITLRNDLPSAPAVSQHSHAAHDQAPCNGASPHAPSSTNLHFHGLEIPPVCHQDETLFTSVEPGGPAFEYRVKIPVTESPGLYWYHPHPHGFTEPQVLGGASGALIVEGIEQRSPRVAGLPERVLVLRDQRVPQLRENDEDSGPGKDLSINYVPVMYPLYRPATIIAKPEAKEFWRVLNAAADTYFDLQLLYGVTIQQVKDAQPIDVVALDGVSVDPEASPRTHILLAPGARAEFIVSMPRLGTAGQLVTLKYDTGPDGAVMPYRAIANLAVSTEARRLVTIPNRSGDASTASFKGLAHLAPVQRRTLYFSEVRENPDDPASRIKYFVTQEGATPKTFDMNFKEPDITVRQGTVEDWLIENRARESHVFHIHQLHFQVIGRGGRRVDEAALRDTIDLPYWEGPGHPYPSVKLRMDFRNPDIVGLFVYHCHILEHEDGGMMGSIRVLPVRKSKPGQRIRPGRQALHHP
jgi:FtsP/CotA-like multicopper oxidase with cupredoxin domain